MKKQLLVALLLVSVASLFAQTKAERDLESAVRKYNAMRDYSAALKPATVTDADIANVGKSVDEGLTLLDPIIKKESGDIVEVARYFRMNYLYEKGFLLGMKGRRAEAFELLQTIDGDMNSFTSARFPLRYSFEGRNFVIKWENFAPTQGEYFVSMTEFSFSKKDYDNALAYAGKANANASFLSDYLRAINNYWIVQMKNERREYDRVSLDAAVMALESYHELDADQRQSSGDLSKLLDMAPATVDNILTQHTELQASGEPYARVAKVMRAEGKGDQYRNFAAKAIRAGYRDREFLEQALNDAATARDRQLGLLAAERLSNMTAADDCAGLAKLADQFELIGEKKRAEEYRSKSSACTRRQHRAQARAQRDFGLYVGGYVLPLFRKDWGGVLGIQTRKVYIEASYLAASNNRDRLWDLRFAGVDGYDVQKIYWDGYYAHLAVNGIARDSRRGFRPYTGVLMGYNYREFDAITSAVFDHATNTYQGTQTFEPVQKSYILMVNFGAHSYGRLLAADLYFSLGAAFNSFDRGNEAFADNDSFLYE
ncbi:MAG TPA: hypothetical protein PKL15_09075, partial [Saprospiraceae bacterium]|nr:hypothetical protein [Saprospiraceae bacterium]